MKVGFDLSNASRYPALIKAYVLRNLALANALGVMLPDYPVLPAVEEPVCRFRSCPLIVGLFFLIDLVGLAVFFLLQVRRRLMVCKEVAVLYVFEV